MDIEHHFEQARQQIFKDIEQGIAGHTPKQQINYAIDSLQMVTSMLVKMESNRADRAQQRANNLSWEVEASHGHSHGA